MKIIDIETFPIYPPIAERYQHVMSRDGTYLRRVAKVKTDNGIVGYGDLDGPGPPRLEPADVEHLIDRNPFDFINSDIHPAVVMALYDVMGKYLEMPAYKLMGQKLRDAVPVAAWSWGGPTTDEFRDDIVRAVDQGYMIFKIHTNPLNDVLEWLRAAEEVAPPGFKIHLDFTGRRGRTMATVLPLVAELERNHPIVGWIEDPFDVSDIEGWRNLRSRTTIPIVHGGSAKLTGLQEAAYGMADAYMIGGPIGETLAKGWAYSKMNLQTITQFCGGTLGKAMALHMSCVLPTATGHNINLDDQCDVDFTTKRIEVIEGSSPVPEAPGLGFEVDEEVLTRFRNNVPRTPADFVGIVEMPGGNTLYSLGQPHITQITGVEEGVTRGLDFQRWFDDGTSEWAATYARVKRENYFFK
jgi:L-alanine-DL-glutamate epimerase-like enolase superfamily enzyme